MRIDKWLWAARFYKTRSIAQTAIEGGHVKVNGERCKPGKEVAPGDRVHLTIGDYAWDVTVCALSMQRGPASVARELYEESEESRAARSARVEARRPGAHPEADRRGRPTKRERRDLDRWKS